MKIINSFFKIVSAIIIFFALTFSNNVNATSSSLNITNSVSLAITSANIALVSGDHFKKRPKRSRCKRCGRKKCGGRCNGGGGDSIPLDGGLSFLVLGAAAFGITKLRGSKNDKI